MAATEGADHSLRYVNAAFCSTHGKDVGDLLGHPIRDVIPPAIADSILSLLDRVYTGGESGTVNSLRFTHPEHGFVRQSYTAWAIPITDELDNGLVIQVGLPADDWTLDENEDIPSDELRQINEQLLISSIRQHEVAEISGRTQRVLSQAFERERGIAEALQYSVLNTSPEDAFPGLAVATIYEAALDDALVGGDFFDTVSLPNGRVMLVVGDVTGKGLQAAARTVEVKYALRAFAQDYTSPGDAVARLNDYIIRSHSVATAEDHALVVLLMTLIEPMSGSVQVISAGAEPPFIVRAGGAIEEVPTSGMMLGVASGVRYTQFDEVLHAGDVMVMTTDGLTEARRGLDFFGFERIAEIVRHYDPAATLHEIGRAIVEAARAHAGGRFRDDVCILLVRRK